MEEDEGPNALSQPSSDNDNESAVEQAVMRAKSVSTTKVNWPAVVTFLVISAVGLISAVLLPPTSDGGIRHGAAMGIIFGAIALVAAVLYRYEPSLQIVTKLLDDRDGLSEPADPADEEER